MRRSNIIHITTGVVFSGDKSQFDFRRGTLLARTYCRNARVERSLVIIWVVALGLLLVKAHLAHLCVQAGTTPFESAASLSSSTKRSEFVGVEASS